MNNKKQMPLRLQKHLKSTPITKQPAQKQDIPTTTEPSMKRKVCSEGVNDVLFLNHKKQQCGVYQYGKRVYNILTKCSSIRYTYKEVENLQEYNDAIMKGPPYNAVIFNYVHATMPWLNKQTIQKQQENVGICHDFFTDFFDKHISIVPEYQGHYTIPRPLFEDIPHYELKGPFSEFVSYKDDNDDSNTPIFGSFGFGFNFKGFHKIVKMVNDQYDKAIIKFVIPSAAFDGDPHTVKKACDECRRHNRKEGITLMIHTDFVSEEELLMFLQSNTMNIFLYDKLHDRGISSVADYALSVGVPLGISDSLFFRHIYDDRICLYKTTIDDCMKVSVQHCEPFRSLYSHRNMLEKFKEILLASEYK